MLKIKPLPSTKYYFLLREKMLRKKKKNQNQTKLKFSLKCIQCISWHSCNVWGLHLQHHLYWRITSFHAFYVPCFSVFPPLASLLLTLPHHICLLYTKSNEKPDPLCWTFEVTCNSPNGMLLCFKTIFLLNKAGSSSSGTIRWLRYLRCSRWIKPQPCAEQVILQILLFNCHGELPIRKLLGHWRYGQPASGWWREMLRELRVSGSRHGTQAVISGIPWTLFSLIFGTVIWGRGI